MLKWSADQEPKTIELHREVATILDRIDADDVARTVKLIRRVKPRLVMNMALPYQDLPIMDACLEAGVDYLDTANYVKVTLMPETK